MEQILKEELEAFSACTQKRTIEEMLPSWIVMVGVSILTIKMERPSED